MIGKSLKENEKRVAIHPEHIKRIPRKLRKQITFEEGYGSRFGMDNNTLAKLTSGRVACREKIKTCTENFLKASNGQNPIQVIYDSLKLEFSGNADLIAYLGHNGLMDFKVNIKYDTTENNKKDVIILACFSKSYFSPEIRKAKANPILWTTHLMAPEAYTLKSAIDGWILNESGAKIGERAAQTYNKYQKCGIKGARNLFTTGF